MRANWKKLITFSMIMALTMIGLLSIGNLPASGYANVNWLVLETADLTPRARVAVTADGQSFTLEGLAGAAAATHAGQNYSLAAYGVELRGVTGNRALYIDGMDRQGGEPFYLKLTDVDMAVAEDTPNAYNLHNSLTPDGAAPVGLFNGANAIVMVDGTSALTATHMYAGIQAPEGTSVTVTSDSAGTLTVRGGMRGAGIGSSISQHTGELIIEGDITVTAYGGNWCPGIGGGGGGHLSNGLDAGNPDYRKGYGGDADITIRGSATIWAYGSNFGPGIGVGGISADIGCPTFMGGSAKIWIGEEAVIKEAKSATTFNASGIGGAQHTGNIDITITDNAIVEKAIGLYCSAGIGGGKPWADTSTGNYLPSYTNIIISGNAEVWQAEGVLAAGIGGGLFQETVNIHITDNALVKSAISQGRGTDASGAGIGGGNGTADVSILIDGNATIENATSMLYGAGIGGGNLSNARSTGSRVDVTIGGSATIKNAIAAIQGAGIGGGSRTETVTVNIGDDALIQNAVCQLNGGAGVGGGLINPDYTDEDIVTVNIGGNSVIQNAEGSSYGSGIGGGYKGMHTVVNIGGNAIIAHAAANQGAGSGGAGIGSAYHADGDSADASITIDGQAQIKQATGANNGAGIGGGRYTQTAYLTIGGQSVITSAIGGNNGAGIGGGMVNENVAVVLIDSAVIKSASSTAYGAGIGSGFCTNSLSVSITDNVHIHSAIGGEAGAGIGGGEENATAAISLTGQARVDLAQGGEGAAGIGLGASVSTLSYGSATTTARIYISNEVVVVKALGGDNGAGIGAGYSPVIGPEYTTSVNITVTAESDIQLAQGGDNAPGIGSGSNSTLGSISITGTANVNALGGTGGAGIGSGNAGTIGNIFVMGEPTIFAQGNAGGAGIGGGDNCTVPYINLTSGHVLAIGSDKAHGIGDGANGTGAVVTVGADADDIVAYAKNNYAFAPGAAGQAATHVQNMFISDDATAFIDLTDGAPLDLLALRPIGHHRTFALPTGYTSFGYSSIDNGDHLHLAKLEGTWKPLVETLTAVWDIPNDTDDLTPVPLWFANRNLFLVTYVALEEGVQDMPSPDSAILPAGDSYTLVDGIPTLEGHTFLGWQLQEGTIAATPDPAIINDTYFSGLQIIPESDLVFVALWQSNNTPEPSDEPSSNPSDKPSGTPSDNPATSPSPEQTPAPTASPGSTPEQTPPSPRPNIPNPATGDGTQTLLILALLIALTAAITTLTTTRKRTSAH